ncbi:restriction endonuclease subunit S [Haemophilus haemolyticus]|uniref:restriction endonuclease subunit S n=1 Tax=Haemophilus haemolyticus TaxID=726 RepID=UPI000E57A9A4|nr:restriction endonuclease subunit S [Haemophilus haemolyticus]
MKNNRTFLDKLLDGAEVEWKPLKKVCNFISTGKLNANAMDENGIYPFFTCNEKPYKINNYAFDMEAILISGNGSQVGHLNYFKGKFNAYQRTYVIGEFDNNTLVMYLYHYLNFKLRDYITINSKKGSVPYITLPMLEKFEIPIPPLSVQTEIVRILDALTALTSELTSELTLRRKQYEYYREKLLSFDSLERLNMGGAKKKLIDVAIYAKVRILADKLDKENYVGVENLLQNKLGKTSSNYVPTDGAFIEYLPNDILIGNIRPYLRKIWLSDRKGGTNGDVLVIRLTDDNILPRYLYHILANEHFFEYNIKYSKGAKMPRGDKAAILQYEFDVPSLEEQHRIVSILDKFETLTNSITEGLPLAIEQNQKRYEYYRELLLDFS